MTNMTRLAIITERGQLLAESLEKSLSHGNRIRVETVVSPGEFSGDQLQIVDFLHTKEIEMVLLTSEVAIDEEVRNALKNDFLVIVATSESPDDVLGQIATVYFSNRKSTPGTTPDQQWSQQLNIPLPEEKSATPPPVPGAQERGTTLPPLSSQQAEPMPPTYLLLSVLSIVLCCFIPGVIAVVFSSQVSSRYFAGDIEGAKKASRNAEICIILSFVLGVLSATLYLPLMLIS